MKALYLLLFVVSFTLPVTAQPNIEWQQSIGGNADDGALGNCIQQTADGGYIVCAMQENDYSIIKLSSTGAIDWQKNYGGTNIDQCMSIAQTFDGGYILSGSTNSRDGDVTGNHGGNNDYWVVKLSAT